MEGPKRTRTSDGLVKVRRRKEWHTARNGGMAHSKKWRVKEWRHGGAVKSTRDPRPTAGL